MGTEVRIIKNLEYAVVNNISLKLDLYLPKNAKSRPFLVMFIHGGAWMSGDKSSCKIIWLLDYGYAVASINYRLSWQATFPAQIHDCKGAVRWLRAHADEYGYRKNRIGAAGSSAGGHLAALLATTGGMEELEGDVGGNLDQSSRVQAVIDMYGPTDFIAWYNKYGAILDNPLNPIYQLLGGPVGKNLDKAKLASPAYQVTKKDVPILILHGNKDQVVPISQGRILHRRYKRKGLFSILHIIKGAGHGGPQFQDETRRELISSFLKENLVKKNKTK